MTAKEQFRWASIYFADKAEEYEKSGDFAMEQKCGMVAAKATAAYLDKSSEREVNRTNQ